MTARAPVVPVADYDRALAQRDTANARCEAAVRALRDVMRTLRASAGSPAEQRVYAQARAVLAEAGAGEAEVAEYQAAFEAWEARRR